MSPWAVNYASTAGCLQVMVIKNNFFSFCILLKSPINLKSLIHELKICSKGRSLYKKIYEQNDKILINSN